MIQAFPWTQWSELQPTWERLHAVTPQRSFFTAKLWVSLWLEIFGPSLNPTLYVWRPTPDAEPQAAWLLVRCTRPWHHLPIRQVYLGTAGEGEADGVCVEYNGFVCAPEFLPQAIAAIWETVQQQPWDEFLVPGAPPELGQQIQDRTPAGVHADATLLPTLSVDLTVIRGHGEYLDHLSYNTRRQLRKSFRYYETRGPLTTEVASTAEQALAMLDQLAELHQKTWVERGERGVFASPLFTEFHRRLISRSMESVQMVRVQAGADVLGLLYSLVLDGVLHTYQSGFHYEENNNNARPGLVVTSRAVEHSLANTNLTWFDLMAANVGRYKNSLSTVEGRLGWYSYQAPTLRNKLRQAIRQVLQRVRTPAATASNGQAADSDQGSAADSGKSTGSETSSSASADQA